MLVGEGAKRIDPSTRNIDTDISICHGSTPILVSGVGGGRPLPATVQGGQPFRKRLGRALSYATVLQDQGCIQGPARLPYDMDRSNKGAFRKECTISLAAVLDLAFSTWTAFAVGSALAKAVFEFENAR